MSFLVLLLAVWVEKFSAGRQRIQQDGWWLEQLRRVEAAPAWQAAPWLSLARLVLLPVLLLALLLWLLTSVAYGWLALPVHLLVLIYALGRGDVLPRWALFAMPGAVMMSRPLTWWPPVIWTCRPMRRMNCWRGYRAICSGRPIRAFLR